MLRVVTAKSVTSSAGSNTSFRQRGFTLLELLVVLVLAATLMAIAPPLISKAIPGTELKSTTRQIASGLRFARNHAIATRQETRLVVDIENRQFEVTGRARVYAIPQSLDIELFTAQIETESESRGGIRFFPTGGSTGGRVTVAYKGRAFLIDVDWLTGKVRILEPEAT